jgi:hypothetical protein
MGRHTKDAAVLLTAAIGGGGIFPPIMYAALKIHNAKYAFCVVAAAFAGGTLYPIWLNALPASRQISDPIRDEESRRLSRDEEKDETGVTKPRRFSKLKKRLSLHKANDQLPQVEHRERRSWPEGAQPSNGSMNIEPVDPVLPVLRTYSQNSTSGNAGRR